LAEERQSAHPPHNGLPLSWGNRNGNRLENRLTCNFSIFRKRFCFIAGGFQEFVCAGEYRNKDGVELSFYDYHFMKI
jgi:hypothetical protein